MVRHANVGFHRAALFDFQLRSFEQRCAFHFWRVEQDFTVALMVAVCMPVAVSAPVSGSYSITASSGNDQRIGPGRRSRIVIRENSRQHKAGIKFTTEAQFKHLLTH